MASASQETQKFGQDLKHAVAGFVGFEALKTGISSLKEYVVGAIEGVAQTSILAQRVGMSSQAFQRLAYSAKLAHVDQDGLTISLEQMNKRLAEVAIEGSGPAADAIRRFGLTARGLAAMGPEKAMATLLEVISQVANPMERAAVAQDLFGRSGQQMINVALKGAGALKAQGDEAAGWGVALSDIDSAKVEEASQSFIRLGAASQGFANIIVAQLSPFIVELTDRYIEWGYQGTKSASFVAQGMDWISAASGRALDGFHGFKTVFHLIEMAIGEMVSYFLAGIEHMLEGIDWVAKKLGKDSDLASTMRGWSQGFEDAAIQHLDAAESAWEKVGKGHEIVRKLVNDVQRGANVRASVQVQQQGSLIGGALSKEHQEKVGFGGAFELGSKEAYSAVVKSMFGRAEQTEQRKIAGNTQRTAGATERAVALLERVAGDLRSGRPPAPSNPAAF
jgi:hypothetical protein